jgi:hypothetical protein
VTLKMNRVSRRDRVNRRTISRKTTLDQKVHPGAVWEIEEDGDCGRRERGAVCGVGIGDEFEGWDGPVEVH